MLLLCHVCVCVCVCVYINMLRVATGPPDPGGRACPSALSCLQQKAHHVHEILLAKSVVVFNVIV